MRAKYTVKMTTLTPKMAKAVEKTFTVDPLNHNRFYLQFDIWTKVVIDINRRRWWEFWK